MSAQASSEEVKENKRRHLRLERAMVEECIWRVVYFTVKMYKMLTSNHGKHRYDTYIVFICLFTAGKWWIFTVVLLSWYARCCLSVRQVEQLNACWYFLEEDAAKGGIDRCMQDVENKKKWSFVHVFSRLHFTFFCNLYSPLYHALCLICLRKGNDTRLLPYLKKKKKIIEQYWDRKSERGLSFTLLCDQ